MILAPVYCSSEPPPASGPVRSKITPILIFLSWAEADTAIPSTAVAAISPPSTRAAFTTSIGSLPGRVCCLIFVVGAHHKGSEGGCQALTYPGSGAASFMPLREKPDAPFSRATPATVILRRSPLFRASLEGWAAGTRGHPSRRAALRMTESRVLAELLHVNHRALAAHA